MQQIIKQWYLIIITYDNAWWTEKDLIIDYVEKDHDLSEEGQGLYSFVTVDGEEVPCSLYDYELEFIG